MVILSGRKLLLLEAFLFQLISGLILKLVPFRIITRIFALPKNFTSHTSHLKSVDIKQAILRTSRHSPWKNRCLVQSLAGRWMLNRRGISSELWLGVAPGNDNKVIAHAWLQANDTEVVEKSGEYLGLYNF
jgi:hypothetical protein